MYEPTLYVKNIKDKMMIVSVYVDDLIYTENCSKLMEEFQTKMDRYFEMFDMGALRYFLHIEITQNDFGISLSQRKYIFDLLSRYNMKNCNNVPTPLGVGVKIYKNDESPKVNGTLFRSLIGSLMYLTTTRPNILYAVNLLSRFMDDPHENYWKEVKKIQFGSCV